MRYVQYYDTKIGRITIAEEEGFITHILFRSKVNDAQEKETPLIKKAYNQISEYIDGKRKDFDLPIKQKGTDFQQKVWNALCTIPYGKIVSYKDIAVQVGCPKGSRAIGMANSKNDVVIVVPCHRVINTGGGLGGYSDGLGRKKALLKIEGVM